MRKIFTDIKLGRYQEIELNLPISAFEVFKRLYPYCRDIFLLESLGEEGRYNRFSYIGFKPEFLISAHGDSLVVDNKSYNLTNPYLPLLKFPTIKTSSENFCGGLVGFVSYEATKYFEPAFSGYKLYDFPEFVFGFFQDGLIFDKRGKKVVYFHNGKNRLGKIKSLLNKSGKLYPFSYNKLISQRDLEDKYNSMILEAKERILSGDIFQVVLSTKTHFKVTGDKRRIYAILRQTNPAPYMSYIKFGKKEIISASPELLIRINEDLIEHFGTLAGTIRRGRTSKEDNLLKTNLKMDEKEMAEHMMLVDLARNDLGRICQIGSISVPKLASIKSFKYVHHLYSEVRGKLKKKENALSALASCFPAGTLTGAPKIEAMRIVKNLEGEARGPYGGAIGYFSLNGEAMFAIAIRSLFVSGDSIYTQTGSGIVYDSDSEKEYQEVLYKQKGMEEALKRAAL